MALEQNETCDLVSLPSSQQGVDCRRVYNVKLTPYGSLARLNARLVAKGYSQMYGVSYQKTPLAKLTYNRILISFATTHLQPLQQLDIKNAFCGGNFPPQTIGRSRSDLPRNTQGKHLSCQEHRCGAGQKHSGGAFHMIRTKPRKVSSLQ